MVEDSESSVCSTITQKRNSSGNVGGGGGPGWSAEGMLAAYVNFKQSGLPARFFRFYDGRWHDIPPAANDLLRAAFSAGRTAVDADVDGRHYLFDFLGMRMVDCSTAVKHFIAWTDVDGRSFFPREFPKKFTSASEEVVGPRRQWPCTIRLDAMSDLYRGLERVFKYVVRHIDGGAAMVAAYRRVDSSDLRRERLRNFLEFEQKVRCVRGNANVKFGWYGGSADAIASILENGFLTADFGLRLTPVTGATYLSILTAEPDDCKERHLLLCRVILGSPEQVAPDSKQKQPSSDEFDSGVDDLKHPKWYIIWRDNINSQVIPECVVTFKSSILDRPVAKRPSLNVSISELLSELGRFLTPGSTEEIGYIFNQLKKGRISKRDFLRSIKNIAGEELLKFIMKSKTSKNFPFHYIRQ